MTAGEDNQEPRLRLRPAALAWRKEHDEVVVLDLRRDLYHVTNATGTRCWEALDAGATPSELTQLLVDTWKLPRQRAADDVAAFVGQLRHAGLLDTGEDPRAAKGSSPDRSAHASSSSTTTSATGSAGPTATPRPGLPTPRSKTPSRLPSPPLTTPAKPTNPATTVPFGSSGSLPTG